MCLTSRPKVNTSTIVVMSKGDSNLLSDPPSSSISPHQSSLTMGKSESSERFRGDVASLDAVSIESEVGELKKESAQSAFEITSVEPAPDDDLDTTGGRAQPTSMDDSSLRIKLESGESEEENISLSEDVHIPAPAPGDVEPTAANASSVGMVSSGLSSSSATDLNRMQQASATGNGPSVQPGGGRFMKVNKYTRGRWTVRDRETTEERSGTELTSRHTSQSGIGSRTNISEIGLGSPSVGRRGDQHESLHSRSGSELGQTSSASISAIGTTSDNISDKDSTSIHLDRSSTAADTLSRNTSLSSINAPDDRSTDIDIDSQGPPTLGELSETPTTRDVLTTSTSDVGGVSSTSLPPREHPVSHLNGPLDTGVERQPTDSENPVKEAMAHLQKQLDNLLTSKTGMQQENSQLHDKIANLTERIESLKEENDKLKARVNAIIVESPSGQQTAVLQDKNKQLQEENTKLKTELMNLRSALSSLVNKPSDSSVELPASQSKGAHT